MILSFKLYVRSLEETEAGIGETVRQFAGTVPWEARTVEASPLLRPTHPTYELTRSRREDVAHLWEVNVEVSLPYTIRGGGQG